jgi:RimJ/RimL family protein N-acetyltransferase
VEIHCDAANTASAAVPRRLGHQLVEQRPRVAKAPADTDVELVWAVTREARAAR